MLILKKIVIGLSIGVLIAAVFFLSLLLYADVTAWEEKSKKVSPNSNFEIHHYHNTSDYDLHAPYGDYLFLSRPSGWRSPRDGYVIFAGYCGESLNYTWVDNENIKVTCGERDHSRARTVVSRAFDIDVSFHNDKRLP
jgi:hypothetical protein